MVDFILIMYPMLKDNRNVYIYIYIEFFKLR
jgi:hypothetical protein